MRLHYVVAALMLASSEASMAQINPAALTGQRVRLRSAVTPRSYVMGTLVRVHADSVEVAEASGVKQTWPLSRFDRFYVSLGLRGRTRRGLLLGAATGILIGGLGGFLAGDDPPCNTFLCDLGRTSAGKKAFLWGLGLGIIGAAIGAAVGEFFPTDEWEDVSRALLPQAAGRTSDPLAVP